MRIQAHQLKDHDFGDAWARQVEDRFNYDDLQADPHWREDWISFDGVVHHPQSERVFCGITSFAGDIFHAWDRRTRRFVDLQFPRVGDRFDAKFHRSMQVSADGRYLYTATALLHDVDRFHEAPGGGIYRFDTHSGEIVKLGVPIPHVYIQSIILDAARGRIYSQHFTPEYLSVFDLATGKARVLGLIGSGFAMAQGENLVLDDRGCAWCGWAITRAWQSAPGPDSHRLCKYDPQRERIVFYKTGLPRRDGGHGFARVEGLFNFGAGCLHASGDNGSLYRIDTDSGAARYLGTPIADRPSRLAAMARHSDGYAYGIVGRQGQCRLLRFDPHNDRYELGDAIVDEQGLAMWQCHDVTVTPDGVLYAGENDHPRRSGYLWEICLP